MTNSNLQFWSTLPLFLDAASFLMMCQQCNCQIFKKRILKKRTKERTRIKENMNSTNKGKNAKIKW